MDNGYYPQRCVFFYEMSVRSGHKRRQREAQGNKVNYTPRSWRQRHANRGHMGKTPRGSGSRRREWRFRAQSLLGFPQERQTGQGEYPRIASLNNFGRLWALRVVSSCLTPGPGMIKAEASCLLGYVGPQKGSGLVSLHSKARAYLAFCCL